MKEVIKEVIKKPLVKVFLIIILAFGLVEVITDFTKSEKETMNHSIGGYVNSPIPTFGEVVQGGEFQKGDGEYLYEGRTRKFLKERSG